MEPEADTVTVLGKLVSELHDEVTFADGEFAGTLKYVTGYTGFSEETDLQSGNYLAVKIGGFPEGATVTVELLGGSSQPVSITDADNAVVRITDATTQKIKVHMVSDDVILNKTYSLAGLTLTPAS